MAKKIDGYIKLNIPAGGANPSPPVGPALGQRGVNIMEFCKAFNAATDSLEKSEEDGGGIERRMEVELFNPTERMEREELREFTPGSKHHAHHGRRRSTFCHVSFISSRETGEGGQSFDTTAERF